MDSANLQRILSEVLEHVRGMWRYRWWAVGVAWPLFVVGWVVVSLLPNVYRASTRLFVDTNTLLKPLMRGLTVSDNSLEGAQIVATAVLTRPNLESVARTTDLTLRATTPEAMEALVTRLQRTVRVTGGRDNIFTIEYEDVSREKARGVVAALADTFVQNSTETGGADTRLTERALSGEIKNHEERLRAAEEALAKFKQDNLGYMPGQSGDYFKQLQAALGEVSGMEEKVHLLVERRDVLKRQLEGEDPVFGIMPAPGAAAGSGCSVGAEIQQLQTQLGTLRVQFTDKHPRVVYMQESIARLQAQCDAEMRAAGDRTNGSVASRTPVESVEANPVYQNLKIQFNTAELDLAESRAQLASNQSAVVKLRRDVDKITEVEAQLKQLNRDYDVVQSRHQELLKRWEDLMAKERLDPVSDNALFRSIEPPFALAKPIGPQRSLLLAAALVVALAAGLAVSFAMNQVRPVYFTRAGLRKTAAFPVLGSISMILTSSDIARRRNGAIIWGAVCLALVLSCAIAIVFAIQASLWMQTLTGAVAI